MDWPDIEALLIARLLPRVKDAMDPDGTRGLSVDASVRTDDLDAGVWFVRVQAIGGTDNGLTERVRVDVEAFAPERADAMDLAHAVRRIMHSLAGTADADGGRLIDTVATAQRPIVLPYRNDKTTRVGASYDVETRLQ